MLLREHVVVRVEDVVAEAGRMQHEHASGDVAFGRAQLRLAAGVEAVKNLYFANVRGIFPRWRIEVELAIFNTLHDRRAGDRLRSREDGEDSVGGHKVRSC